MHLEPRTDAVDVRFFAPTCPTGMSALCIRLAPAMHLRRMEADLDHAHLISAARCRERGALRALALSLDEQLVGGDVAFDGAILAWRAVQGERSPGLMGRITNRFALLRLRLPQSRVPFASVWEVTPDGRPETPPEWGRRPAA